MMTVFVIGYAGGRLWDVDMVLVAMQVLSCML